MCGCTGVRCRWTKDLKNKFPSCGGTNGTATHVTRCTDEGRQDLWAKSGDDLDKWMLKSHTEPTLRTMITTYLRERENRSMTEIAMSIPHNLPSHYSKERPKNLGQVQDRLGWDCMVEGRILSFLSDTSAYT